MSDKPEESSLKNGNQETPDDKNTKEQKNQLNSCFGGASDDTLKSIQEDLERAKEANSFSSKSRCVIS